MRLLLDTCTFLWIAEGSEEVSHKAKEYFADPGNEVFLSVVSSWEIAVKYSLGNLPLPEPPERFVPSRRTTYKVQLLPLDEECALHVARLPGLHGDPFDRMLICQAMVHGLTLVTPDKLIAQYGVHTLW